jgi:RNase P/RNase MRP subunit POP5
MTKPIKRAVKTNLGEMKGSFIALNVHACEVSCRAGTIKCSHLTLKNAKR